MKVSVSVPDDVYEKVERLARRLGRSRSEAFSQALAEIRQPADRFARAASRRVLKRGDW